MATPQLPPQKLRRRLIPAHPTPPQQQIMDLIRKNQLFQVHILLAQALHQIDRLLERYITIIVAVYEQHGLFPSRNGRHRRRVPCQLHCFFVIRRVRAKAAANQHRPVMHAVKIDACGKNI
jgi:hypothetical protein